MNTKTIRRVDLEEYRRGQQDRQAGYAVTANGDKAIDYDPQAADAYLAGYDPDAELVPIRPGEEQAAADLLAALKNAARAPLQKPKKTAKNADTSTGKTPEKP